MRRLRKALLRTRFSGVGAPFSRRSMPPRACACRWHANPCGRSRLAARDRPFPDAFWHAAVLVMPHPSPPGSPGWPPLPRSPTASARRRSHSRCGRRGAESHHRSVQNSHRARPSPGSEHPTGSGTPRICVATCAATEETRCRSLAYRIANSLVGGIDAHNLLREPRIRVMDTGGRHGPNR